MTLQLFVTNPSEPHEESCVCTLTGSHGKSLCQTQEIVLGSLQLYNPVQNKSVKHLITAHGFV